MSIHLIERAALTELPPAKKLILMAFADSADKHTRRAMPGLENVLRWAGVGRSRALELVAELVDDGLLSKHRAGHKGRRAEYVVMPGGCCAEHGPLDDETEVIGSDLPDPMPPDDQPDGSGGPDPMNGKGSGKGPVGRTPSPAPKEQPPHPPAAECPRHGSTPAPNCRGCGTTVRQLQAARRRQAAEAERERQRAENAARRLAQARASPTTVETALTTARQQIRAARNPP